MLSEKWLYAIHQIDYAFQPLVNPLTILNPRSLFSNFTVDFTLREKCIVELNRIIPDLHDSGFYRVENVLKNND